MLFKKIFNIIFKKFGNINIQQIYFILFSLKKYRLILIINNFKLTV